MSSARGELHPDENLKLGGLAPQIVRISGLTGVIFLAATIVLGFMAGDGMRRFFHAYLIAFLYFLSIALGALFFTVIQHIVRAKWSIVVRRIAELFMGTFPLLFVLSLGIFVPMLLGYHGFYPWSDPKYAKAHELVAAKTAYLNVPFFAARIILYFALWTVLARYFLNTSLRQDETGDADLSEKMRRMAGPTLVIFALTVVFAAFDLIMSLKPNWFSTVFGIYYFAGCAMSIMAVLILSSMWLQRRGRLVHSITTEHYHDLGKLLFAFIFFWGYIAFSQFMLMWYANIPEQTYWFVARCDTIWVWVTYGLLFFHLLLPFAFLTTRHTKRRKITLGAVAAWMLIMHWVDLYWVIMPDYNSHHISFRLMDVTATLGIGGLFVATVAQLASNARLLPVKDPGLGESLQFENY